jgi:hypothetical protein
MLNSGKFDNMHDRRTVDAASVESWFQRDATILLGEEIKANSWVFDDVKAYADHIWQKVLSGEYQSLQYREARLDFVNYIYLPDTIKKHNAPYRPSGDGSAQ